MLHISIKAETLFSLFGLPVTNSLLASWVLIGLFTILAVHFYKNYNNKKSRLVFFILFIVNGLYSTFHSILKDNTKRFFPLLASFLLYILLSNWLGLLPGVGSVVIEHESVVQKQEIADTHEADGAKEKKTDEAAHEGPVRTPILRAATADLNMTLGLGLLAFVFIQGYGVMFNGVGGYLKKFINFSNPINFFSGILELISEFSKIISFAFRLFGNIFAGEVLLAVVAFLIPVLASFPFLLLEIFVGFIQGLVFAMLVAVFLNMAIAKHH